jgi:hypothetical protein
MTVLGKNRPVVAGLIWRLGRQDLAEMKRLKQTCWGADGANDGP